MDDLEFVPCDGARACRSKSYVFVDMPRGELSFCGHHFAEYEAGLRKVAVLIHDLRYAILG